MKRLAIVLVWLTASTSYCQTPSLLGICHKNWNCNATVKLYDGLEAIKLGWLENTFASNCKCVDRLLQDAREKIIRVHIANGPCMRNKRCGNYEIFAGYTIAKANREFSKGKGISVQRFKRTLNRLKGRLDRAVQPLQCYVSPCLECDLNGRARKVMADMVSAILPKCLVVDNPLRQKCLDGAICEKHGFNPELNAPCIVDSDGVDGSTIDVNKFIEQYKQCDLTYYWEPWMNCIRGKFIDPRKRNCNYDSSLFEMVKGLLCQYSYQSLDICLH